MSIKRIVIFIFGIWFFAACNEPNDPFQLDELKEYFPLQIGSRTTYQVDSILFDRETGFQTRDTISLIVEELLTDTFRDPGNNLIYRIERKERPLDSIDWQSVRIWTTSLRGSEAIRHEENLDFVKMTFPLHKNDDWNGNKYFPENIQISIHEELLEVYKYWHYFVESIDKNETVGDFSFERIMTIEQVDEDNLLERRFSVEKYAFGIGLVFKEQIILDSQCNGNPIDCIDKSWEDKADKGFILRQTIISYE